jgi:HEAT repeat protein
MRAIAIVQPPQITEAFAAGLKDASAHIRKIASGGWFKAASIPESMIPALVEALSDPETPVRANAARALAQFEDLPAEAVPPLLDCTADASDAVRMNATMALRRASGNLVVQAMHHLLEDPNPRIRLVAASSLLGADADNARASSVVIEALSNPAPRVRKAGLELLESLGTGGAQFSEAMSLRTIEADEPALRESLARVIAQVSESMTLAATSSGVKAPASAIY